MGTHCWLHKHRCPGLDGALIDRIDILHVDMEHGGHRFFEGGTTADHEHGITECEFYMQAACVPTPTGALFGSKHAFDKFNQRFYLSKCQVWRNGVIAFRWGFHCYDTLLLSQTFRDTLHFNQKLSGAFWLVSISVGL